MRGCWQLKEDALDRNVWRIRFGSGYGPVVRQITERINEWMDPVGEFSVFHTVRNSPQDNSSFSSKQKGRLTTQREGGRGMKLIARPHFLITWLLIKHRDNYILMNGNICISVSRKTDRHTPIGSRVVKGRLGCNGASLCDTCTTFRGCSDVSQRRIQIAQRLQWCLATSNTSRPVEQREITEREDLNDTAAKASKLASRWILRNLKMANRSLTHYRVDINRDLNAYRLNFLFPLNTVSAPIKCQTCVFNSPQLSYTDIYVCRKHIEILATDVTCHAQILSCWDRNTVLLLFHSFWKWQLIFTIEVSLH